MEGTSMPSSYVPQPLKAMRQACSERYSEKTASDMAKRERRLLEADYEKWSQRMERLEMKWCTLQVRKTEAKLKGAPKAKVEVNRDDNRLNEYDEYERMRRHGMGRGAQSAQG
jgi:hypothetical protein